MSIGQNPFSLCYVLRRIIALPFPLYSASVVPGSCLHALLATPADPASAMAGNTASSLPPSWYCCAHTSLGSKELTSSRELPLSKTVEPWIKPSHLAHMTGSRDLERLGVWTKVRTLWSMDLEWNTFSFSHLRQAVLALESRLKGPMGGMSCALLGPIQDGSWFPQPNHLYGVLLSRLLNSFTGNFFFFEDQSIKVMSLNEST